MFSFIAEWVKSSGIDLIQDMTQRDLIWLDRVNRCVEEKKRVMFIPGEADEIMVVGDGYCLNQFRSLSDAERWCNSIGLIR